MRALLLVCDSFGVGATPDAASYGDEGADTLGNTSRAVGGIEAPNLERLGLGLLTEIQGVRPVAGPGTAHGTMRERSAGKDTTTGHWEIAGVVTERPFPTYPDGFPPEVIRPFEERVGAKVLGNRTASGTEIIQELGAEHLATGRPIVYTSADSVFQIAAHKDVVPLDRLYEWCRMAREILDGEHRVGRVIARPFVGEPGSFTRTHERRDFSVEPPEPTYLARIQDLVPVYGVGKIPDIFVERGLTESRHSESNDHGVDLTIEYLERGDHLLVVTNLVDFDTTYGHRNDAEGYARCVEAFDRRLPDLLEAVGDGLLFLTGDHGCDPTDESSTDHTREHVPALVGGGALEERDPVDLGVRETFADLGATVAAIYGVGPDGLAGTSFAAELGLG